MSPFAGTILEPFALAFLNFPYVVPALIVSLILQLWLQWKRRPWNEMFAAFLVLVPALLITSHVFMVYHLIAYDELSRASVWDNLPEWVPTLFWRLLWPLVFVVLALWESCEFGLRASGRPGHRCARIFMAGQLLALLVLLSAIDIGLKSYVSLEDAVRMGDVELVRKRLDFNLEGVGLHNGYIVPEFGDGTYYEPVLPIAVEERHYDVAKLLIERGARVNYGGIPYHASAWIDAFPPIRIAVQKGDLEMTKLLLEHGADPAPALDEPAAKEGPIAALLREYVSR